MEQAVNLFTKGLQTDTNPMMLGSDTLSDCLNGTIITMNGNEVALQNDMGNRRVDSAFLPPGYEPVGMKEYGGIIYVAAYNPLTGRGLLGSFPSPLKKIRGEDTESFLNLNNFVETVKNCRLDYFNYIVKRDQLTLLTQLDILLHAGDKFIILGSVEQPDPLIQSTPLSLTFLNSVISNYYPGSGNKKLNMLVGVLNSQNEFVDITDSLLRQPLTGGNYSEGFYIWNKNNYPDGDTGVVHTLKNEEFNQDRLVEYVNTYAYKLVGPLCLKTSLNYPTEVEYSVYGEKRIEGEGNRTYYFEITVTYTHVKDVYLDGLGFFINSLDGLNYCETNWTYYYETSESESSSLEPEDKESGLVTTKTVYSKEITLPETVVLLNYTLMPIFKYPTGEIVPQPMEIGQPIELGPALRKGYIKEFSYTGELDLTKLGSDSIELNSWRYYNNLSSKETTFFIDYTAYPKKNSEILKISLNIGNNYITLQEPIIGSGNRTITIPWEDIIEPKKLYTVKLGYFKSGIFYPFTGTVTYIENSYTNISQGVNENNKYEYVKVTYEETNENNEQVEVAHTIPWTMLGELALPSTYILDNNTYNIQYKFIITDRLASYNNIKNFNTPYEIENWEDYSPADLISSDKVIYYRRIITNENNSSLIIEDPKIWRTSSDPYEYTYLFINSSNKPILTNDNVFFSSLSTTPQEILSGEYTWMIYRSNRNNINTFYDMSTWSEPVRISNAYGQIGTTLEEDTDGDITFEFKTGNFVTGSSQDSCYFVSTELFNGNYYGTEPGWEGGAYNYNIHSNVYIDDFRTIESVLMLPDLDWNVILKEDRSYPTLTLNVISSSSSSDLEFSSIALVDYINNITCTTSFNENLYPKDNIPDIKLNNIEVESRQVGNLTFTFETPTTIDGKKKYISTEQYPNDDLVEYSGTTSKQIPLENNSEIPIIKLINTSISETPIKNGSKTRFLLASKYNIYEFILGESVQEDIIIQNPIISFRKFVEENGLALINPPYGNLSMIELIGNSVWLVTGNCSTGAQAAEAAGTPASNRLSSNLYSANKNYINEVLLSGHENDLFVADFDDTNWINGWVSGSRINLNISRNNTTNYLILNVGAANTNSVNDILDDNNGTPGFARVWLRYNKNSIVPILVYGPNYKNQLPQNVGDHILIVCDRVNRYYNYNIDEKIISGKYILDIYNCLKTKEFDFETYNTIKYNIELVNSLFNTNSEFFKFETISGLTSKFKDLNIKSSKLYKKLEEELAEYSFNSALITNDNNIIIFEKDFNEFDLSYVYKSNSSTIYEKYYIPKSKFSIEDSFLIPNLTHIKLDLTCVSFNGTTDPCSSLIQLAYMPAVTNDHFFFDELPDIFENT